jgi:WD40 repeat protein
MTFSPDGTTLAAGSDNSITQLWDVPTQQPIGDPLTSPGVSGPVRMLAFSSDGKTLISSTGVGTQLWHLSYLVNAVPYLCKLTGRALTSAEWAQYVPSIAYQNICS